MNDDRRNLLDFFQAPRLALGSQCALQAETSLKNSRVVVIAPDAQNVPTRFAAPTYATTCSLGQWSQLRQPSRSRFISHS